jgi:hypothetical protein
MPANKHFLLYISLTAVLIVMAGCGGGTSLSFPPPQGGFTNANFNGAYAFSYSGQDTGGVFIASAGSLQADGAGHITGTEDVNDAFNVVSSVAITGTYTVRADGRGSISINSNPSAAATTLDFVLVAGGHALVTRFDGVTGSGTIDQQTASAFSNTALAETFAFNFSGIDGTTGAPFGMAGNFTSDTAGNITGVEDSNDNLSVFASDALSGSIPVASTGRGTASFSSARGAMTFAYYVVDATHLKFVETDQLFLTSGDAFNQVGPFSPASLSGSFAFTVAGTDLNSGGPFAAGGVVTSDGVSAVTGVEDLNDGAVLAGLGVTGSYTMAANGRGTLSLTSSAGTSNFSIYPTSNGVITFETDSLAVVSGTALQQQGPFTNASFSGTYGMNFTSADNQNGVELDSIAEFTADGASSYTGIIDVNDGGLTTFGQPLNGTFAVSANGRATGTIATSTIGTRNVVYYLASPTRSLFIDVTPDEAFVSAGDIRHQ